MQMPMLSSSQLASAIEELVPIDYLACYDELDDEDRADWDELIAVGELPRHDQLRQMAPDFMQNK